MGRICCADALAIRLVIVREGEPVEPALRVTTEPSSRTLILEGEFDLGSTDRFDQALAPLLDGGGPVTLNVESLEFMDSSGLRAVIQSSRKAEKLVILKPRGQVEQLFRLCDLERLQNVSIEGASDG
jgi:anti-anti-sigma factor